MRSSRNKIPLIVPLLSIAVISSADLLDNATSMINTGVQNVTSSVNSLFDTGTISNLFSIPGLNLQKVNCSVGLDHNYLSDINNMCSMLGNIIPKLSYGVGSCTLNSDQSRCANNYMASYCRNLSGKIVSKTKDGEAMVLSPLNVTGLSVRNNILTGGDIVMSGKRLSCDSRVNSLYSNINYGSGSESKIDSATTMKSLPGKSAFTRDVELARDALRMGATTGKLNVNNSSAAWVANKGMGLPQTITDAQKNMNETITMQLDPANNNLASGMVKTESMLSDKLANCSASTDYENCKNTQLASSSDTDIPTMTDSTVTKTELESAKLLKLMEDAGRGKRLIVHYDDDSISSLPIQSKAIYASAMRRQIAFQTAYRFLASESAAISKEVIRISTQKMTESARPFFEDQALKEIAGAIK
ncbi:MAG: hypothetical protein PHT07_10585 [Paludibacter sp.]|nr:hypothetical protein [Paludibacter sp.]